MKRDNEKVTEAVRLRVSENLSYGEISRITGLSKSTLSSVLKPFPLPKDILEEKKKNAPKATNTQQHLRDLSEDLIVEEQSRIKSVEMESLTTIFKRDRGILGEYLVRYKLLRLGFVFYEPKLLTECLDLIVVGKNSGKIYRCEIKASDVAGNIHISHSEYVSGNGMQRVPYEKSSNIDIFIVVDLISELIAILPGDEFFGKRSVFKLTPNSQYWKYVSNFGLLD